MLRHQQKPPPTPRARARTPASSFYHLVGTGEERGWKGEAERLGSLEINHELVFGGSSHGHFGGILAVENTGHISCRLPVLIHIISSIRNQAATSDVQAL